MVATVKALAKSQLQKAAVHLERVYPTEQLQKAIEDLHGAMDLAITLPPADPVVDAEIPFKEQVGRIVGDMQVAEIWLQSARRRLTALQARVEQVQG